MKVGLAESNRLLQNVTSGWESRARRRAETEKSRALIKKKKKKQTISFLPPIWGGLGLALGIEWDFIRRVEN